MRTKFTLLLLCILRIAFPQTFKEKELKTGIKEVTVFLNSAQIFESGTATVSSGKTILKIKGLPPFMDEKSIQVKGEGNFTILSVNHKLNYLKELKKDDKLDSLQRIVEFIDEEIIYEQARLGVLHDKQSLLVENRNLGGESAGVTILQLRQALELYESEIPKLKSEEIKIKKSIAQKQKRKEEIQKQLQELNEQTALPTSEIEIRVSADHEVNGKFRITYLVGNAGWYPKYDIRVQNIKSPLQIMYKAEVFQNTGVDWKNVKLRFSNGNPNQSGLVPELTTWQLNFARNTSISTQLSGAIPGISTYGASVVRGIVLDEAGLPVPGVNVVVKGTTIGTATDAHGNYQLSLPNKMATLVFSFIGYQPHERTVTQPIENVSLTADVMQLQEMVVTGYGMARKPIHIRGVGKLKKDSYVDSQPIPTTIIENQTTVEIEVSTPYTIQSNGEKLLVDLKSLEVDAIYQYYAIPKLDKDAFLVARIINWDQHNLLEGEANLYFEDAYVGRSVLNAKSMQDTLDISLGRDKNIVIGREKNEQYCKRKTIGSNVSESRGFKITVRNKKSQPVKLTVFDQLPVSVVSDISVDHIDLSNGQLDEKTGKVYWELTMDAQQQKEINLQYEVKYPKREKVYLE